MGRETDKTNSGYPSESDEVKAMFFLLFFFVFKFYWARINSAISTKL